MAAGTSSSTAVLDSATRERSRLLVLFSLACGSTRATTRTDRSPTGSTSAASPRTWWPAPPHCRCRCRPGAWNRASRPCPAATTDWTWGGRDPRRHHPARRRDTAAGLRVRRRDPVRRGRRLAGRQLLRPRCDHPRRPSPARCDLRAAGPGHAARYRAGRPPTRLPRRPVARRAAHRRCRGRPPPVRPAQRDRLPRQDGERRQRAAQPQEKGAMLSAHGRGVSVQAGWARTSRTASPWSPSAWSFPGRAATHPARRVRDDARRRTGPPPTPRSTSAP
ncbi:hypothetical protein SGLAM104S_05720 [Streptomyces glaucescens]